MTASEIETSFDVIPGDPDSRIVIHVPHSSTHIPTWVCQRIRLEDEALTHELEVMTDARTDEIAETAATGASLRPWIFVNRCSRLVIDPERFPDPESEPMASPEIGMGAVYTRTAQGEPLRDDDPEHRDALMDRYFWPYAGAMSGRVAERLAAVGSITIIDLHSFPLDESPYERLHHADALRPECCIGVDSTHTPTWLVTETAAAFKDLGESLVNQPFAGTYVPLAYYTAQDARVTSVMVELRRDTYLVRPGGITTVAKMLTQLIDKVQQSTTIV